MALCTQVVNSFRHTHGRCPRTTLALWLSCPDTAAFLGISSSRSSSVALFSSNSNVCSAPPPATYIAPHQSPPSHATSKAGWRSHATSKLVGAHRVTPYACAAAHTFVLLTVSQGCGMLHYKQDFQLAHTVTLQQGRSVSCVSLYRRTVRQPSL